MCSSTGQHVQVVGVVAVAVVAMQQAVCRRHMRLDTIVNRTITHPQCSQATQVLLLQPSMILHCCQHTTMQAAQHQGSCQHHREEGLQMVAARATTGHRDM